MSADWLDTARRAKTAEERRASLVAFRPEHLRTANDRHPFDAALDVLPPELHSFIQRVEEGHSKDVSGLFNDDAYVRSLTPEAAFRAAVQTLRLEYLRFAFGLGSYPEWNHATLPGGAIARATSGLFSRGADVPPEYVTPDDRLTLIHQLHFAIACEPMGRANQPWTQRMRFSILWTPEKWIDVVARGTSNDEYIEGWLALLLPPIDRAAAEIVRVAKLLGHTWSTPKHLVAAQQRVLSLLHRNGEMTEAMRLLVDQEKHIAANQPREEKMPTETEVARAAARESQQIRKRAKPALRLVLADRPTPFSDPVRHSEIGGAPSLAANTEWPHFDFGPNHYPMRFWAQINLRELPQLKSPLPPSGWLLFFSNITPVEQRVPACVMFCEETDAHLLSPPDTLLRFMAPDDPYSDDPRRFLPDDHALARIEFRRRAYAVPVETFADSEDGGGARGWTSGSAYENAFRALEFAAEERADRLIANLMGPGIREPVDAPRLTKLQSYLMGGPYIWADVVAICDTLASALHPYLEPAAPGHAPAAALHPDVATLAVDGVEVATTWRGRAEGRERFTKIDDHTREHAIADFSGILRRADAGLRARSDIRETWQLAHNSRDTSGLPQNYWILQSARNFNGITEIAPFNMRLAAHEGHRLEDLYPQWLVDSFCPSSEVRRLTYAERAASSTGSIHHEVSHQMLGWGASVQSAPARHRDKILLLQIGGGELAALPDKSTALQFWINENDLGARRFDRAFATIESN